MNLANKLTILRILLVPLMVIIPFFNIQGNLWGIPITYIIIDIIFVIAALTDKLDGHIARSRNQITTFGKFLDPIADKSNDYACRIWTFASMDSYNCYLKRICGIWLPFNCSTKARKCYSSQYLG